MAGYEDQDGGPRYGQRLSPEELAAYLREQDREQAEAAGARGAHRAGRVEGGTHGGDGGTQRGGGEVGAQDGARSPAAERGAPDGDPYARRPVPAAAPVPGTDRAARPARRGRRRWATLVVGLVLLLVVPGIMTISAVVMVLDGSLSAGAVLAEDGTVYLEKGTTSALYSAGVGSSTQSCTVTGPDGTELAMDKAVEGASYVSFTASQTGNHTVSCPQGTADVVVGPPMNLSRLPLASILVVTAAFIGLVGLVVTVIGIIRMRR
ncbi:MAG: hypothetical protein Q4C85_09755 [Actinomyces sp.]|uniref:hypothetical protein n=1 Tax=Actinomyces sp. TaxID=29317 RepID=UPI0026DC4244|nr:hypothetical protein [Actinomyces sp.]MDO4244021.1 hypothetical protein [Actinomyces sp.]